MRQFGDRTIEKEYVALVRGEPPAPRGRVEAPIGRDPRDRQRMAVVAGGRDSATEYEAIGIGRWVRAARAASADRPDAPDPGAPLVPRPADRRATCATAAARARAGCAASSSTPRGSGSSARGDGRRLQRVERAAARPGRVPRGLRRASGGRPGAPGRRRRRGAWGGSDRARASAWPSRTRCWSWSSGPSGVGKSTIVAELAAAPSPGRADRDRHDAARGVDGEVDGVHYHFLDRRGVHRARATRDGLLEHANGPRQPGTARRSTRCAASWPPAATPS